MSVSFEVFHLDSVGGIRATLNEAIKNYMKDIPELKSGTINFMDGEEYYSEFLSSNKDFKPTVEMKIGWLGVWASNFNAWKALLDSDYESVILFEDDANPEQRIAERSVELIKRLPEDWDFFSLYVDPNMHEKFNQEHEFGDEEICRAYQDWSLACYAVSRKGAEKALNLIKEVGFAEPIDYFVFNKTNKIFNSYTLKPSVTKLCQLAGLPTTIQDIETRITL
jgi:GR25 family glycosyltransferase involved in LPS biosynthesis